MRSFILNENEMNELSKKQSTPFMVLSLDKVEENYRFLAKHLPRAKTCYAVKANPHDGILNAWLPSARTSMWPRPARWRCSRPLVSQVTA